MPLEKSPIKRESKLPPVPKDAWEILGIKPGASEQEIRNAFRKRSLVFHPDKNINDPIAGDWQRALIRARNELLKVGVAVQDSGKKHERTAEGFWAEHERQNKIAHIRSRLFYLDREIDDVRNADPKKLKDLALERRTLIEELAKLNG